MNINLEKLTNTIISKRELSSDDILIRELLEICSSGRLHKIDITILKKFKARHFMKVYEELFNTPLNDMQVINDMICGEYAKENLLFAPHFIFDDEDIY